MKTWKLATVLAIVALLTVGATLATTIAIGGFAAKATINQKAVAANQVTAPQVLAPVTKTNTTTPTLYTPTVQAISPSYTNGWGWGGCMASRWGWGANANPTTTTATTISINQATDIAQTYVASLNNPDLKVTEVEEYQNNFYVVVGEKSTDNGAFELLINKVTGVITPEMGPNMMWNTEYIFGNGWCNWVRGTITATPTVTADQAQAYAQQYLNAYLLGTTTGDITAFPGHYTIEVLNNGTPYGMLSVNSFTGQVWYHTWHGVFIAEQAVA